MMLSIDYSALTEAELEAEDDHALYLLSLPHVEISRSRAEADRAYLRLCAAVYCAGIKIWQERMDQILAALEGKGR